MIIGYFSTSQQITYGKTKNNKIIYLVKPFDNTLQSYLVPYGGKLKGKLIIVFDINGSIIRVIGLMNESNITITLQYNYNIYRKKLNIDPLHLNILEEQIIRKEIYDRIIFSIDPLECKDVDDALSFYFKNNIYIVSIYIAQPIIWLSEDIMMNRLHTAFSTLYHKTSNDNIWGDNITINSSLEYNKKRAAYCFEFHYDINLKLINKTNYPCTIINSIQTSYDKCLNFEPIKELYNFSKKISDYIINAETLISYWMIQTNQCGQNFNIKIPYRIMKNFLNINEKIEEINKIENENIKNIFLIRHYESAHYSIDDYFKYHHQLKLYNYTHLTSPIRRSIDCIIHWCITYNINFIDLLNKYNISIDHINKLDKQTKKYHRDIALLEKINNIFTDNDNILLDGYIYKKKNNTITIYLEELGFHKVILWDLKFDYLFDSKKKENIDSILTIGSKWKFNIYKKNSFLPKDKLYIIPYEFNFI